MKFFKARDLFTMTPREVQEAVEKTGQAALYVAGNKTEALQALTNGVVDTSKGVLTTHSGARLGNSIFKGAKDYARGDVLCTSLCTVSGTCETVAAVIVIVWLPLPTGKICAISALKGVSYTCMRIRDLCAGDPTNPLC